MSRWCKCLQLILCLSILACNAWAAAPRVELVIGSEASSLEKQAATEIASDLKKIYDAQVTISTIAAAGAEHIIFVGRPGSIPITNENVSRTWPRLKELDHFLLTTKFRGKPALLVGGGSSIATYWAASEYAHSLGVRSMLFSDMYPVAPKPFSLDNYDRLLTSSSDSNTWFETDPFPTGITSWGLEHSKRRLRQLARLKYSSIVLKTNSTQPFAKDIQKESHERSGVLWFGWRFPVSGDTAGRSAFRGAKDFINPDFEGASTYEQRMQAGSKWLSGLVDQAESLGMNLQVQSEQMQSESNSAVFDTKNPFLTFRPLVSDESLIVYQSSRNRFGESLSGETVCSSLIGPICGDGVSASLHKASEQMRNATRLTDENDPQFSMPSPDMILKHFVRTAPAPEWWSRVRDQYLGGMNDMYRVNSRAREGGRSYSLYLARRCEFGFEYMNCVDATRKAAIAGEKRDRTEQRAQLEKAVESINSACAALAAVARDPSDRGMIAVLNEFGYRPLQKELDKLDE